MARRGKNTIVQRIALDGGEEIRKELEALGKEGKEAFEALKRAAENTAKASTGLNAFFTNLNKNIAAIRKSAEDLKKSFKEVGDAARDFGRNVAFMGAAAAAGATAVFGLAKASADLVDAQKDTAIQLGLTLEQFGRLRYAFVQNGSNAADMTAVINRLNGVLGDTADESSAASKLFDRLNVNTRKANGTLRPTYDILLDVADALRKLPEGAERSALAIDIFGRSGAKAVQTLQLGSTAIEKFGDEAVALKLTLSDADAELGGRFNDTLDKTVAIVDAVRLSFGLLFAPVLIDAMEAFGDILIDNREAILSFGETIRDTVAPVIRDVILMLQGKDAQVSNTWLLDIRDVVLTIAEAFRTVYGVVQFVFRALAETLDTIFEPINAIFGTKLRGDVALFTILIASLTGGFRLLGAGIGAVRAAFVFLARTFGQAAAVVTGVIAGVMTAFGTFKVLIDDTIRSIGDFFGGVGALFGFTTQKTEELGATTEDVAGRMGDAFTEASNVTVDALDVVQERSDSVFDEILGWLQGLLDLAGAVGKAIGDMFGGGGGAKVGSAPPLEGKKRGGMMRGPGTGTSDSILARLSDGEFVVRAAAVRKWGAGFFHDLNNFRMPKFALGGEVSSPGVSFASSMDRLESGPGGASGRPLTLSIGGEVFEGLIAPDAVADKIVRYASGRSVRRAGKVPSWYGAK